MNYSHLIVITFLCTASCGYLKEAERKQEPSQPAKVVAAPDAFTVSLSHPEEFPLETVQQRVLAVELEVNGQVAVDVSRAVPINSMTQGRVVEIRARLGDIVRKGDLLLRVQSADLSGTIADFRKAKEDELLARKVMSRAQLLFSNGATAQKDVEVAEDQLRKAQIDTAATEERIRLLGGNPQQLSPVIEIRSPIDGTVIEQNITSGAGVKSLDNSPNLFTIGDFSHVWVVCDVYENDLSHVREGDSAEVKFPAYPNLVARARIGNIFRLLDPQTRSAKVRLEMANPGGRLRAGMFATAKFTSQTAEKRVVVPSRAILRLQDRDWIFAPREGVGFQRIEVKAGRILKDGWQEILSGADAGTKIAKDALQLSRAAEQEKN